MERKALFTAIAIIIAQIASAQAQILYSWTGNVSTDWTNPANWQPTGVPTSNDNIQVIGGNSLPDFNNAISGNNIFLYDCNWSSSVHINANQIFIYRNSFSLSPSFSSDYLYISGSTFSQDISLTSTDKSIQTSIFSGSFSSNQGCTDIRQSEINGNTVITGSCIHLNENTFGNNLNATVGAFSLYSNIINGSCTIEKTGISNDYNSGANRFNGTTTISYISGSGYVLMGGSLGDIFNNDLTLNNYTDQPFYLSYLGQNNLFNGNIFLNSQLGSSILFGTAGGTSTLASGKTFQVGTFPMGFLQLDNFTQQGNTPQNLNLGNVDLRIGKNSTFEGNLTILSTNQVTFQQSVIKGITSVTSSGITLNNSTFEKEFTAIKTGATNDASAGGNIFNGNATFIHQGPGSYYLGLAFGQGDLFNGDVILTLKGEVNFYFAHAGQTQVNGNLYINHIGSPTLYIGEGGGTTNLTDRHSLSIGTDGFNGGILSVKKVIQAGTGRTNSLLCSNGSQIIFGAGNHFSAPLDLNLPNGTTTFQEGSEYAAVTCVSGGVNLNGSVFNGNCSLKKTGTSNDYWSDGNTFNGTFILEQAGSGYLITEGGRQNTYNGSVTLINSSGASLLPAYLNTAVYKSDLLLTSASLFQFGQQNGTASFAGQSKQTISRSGNLEILFKNLEINNPADLQLNAPVTISGNCTFTAGNILSTSNNLITFNNGAKALNASSASFVDGPVKKTGNEAFVFPVGKGTNYQPLGISAPAADTFIAEYFDTAPTTGVLEGTLSNLSTCEYWNLNRVSGSSNVKITLGINASSCNKTDLRLMRVTGWDGNQWKDLGNGSTTGSMESGTITSGSSSGFYGAFTLAQKLCNLQVTLNSSNTSSCAGEPFTFTALPSGLNSYQFFNTGVSIQSSGSNVLSSSMLGDGNIITVKAQDNGGCTSPLSNGVTVTIKSRMPLQNSWTKNRLN